MELPKDVTGWLGTAALGLAGWLWRQLSNKATREELAEAIKQSEKRTDAIFAKLDDMQEDITQTRVDVAEMRGAK
jgi:hypothetical protein